MIVACGLDGSRDLCRAWCWPIAGTTEYLPPGPPILPELPNDLFYPFTLGDDETSAARAVTRSAWRVHVLCAFALAWLVAAAGYSASA